MTGTPASALQPIAASSDEFCESSSLPSLSEASMEREGVDHETVTDLAHPAPTLSPAVLRRMKRTCNSSGGGFSSEEAQDRLDLITARTMLASSAEVDTAVVQESDSSHGSGLQPSDGVARMAQDPVTTTGATYDPPSSTAVPPVAVDTTTSTANNAVSSMLLAQVQCPVCCQVPWNPVATIPCMHNTCHSCYVELHRAGQNDRCVTCRQEVTGVARNHMLQNIINILGQQCPQYARDPVETANMDANVAAFEMSWQSSQSGRSENATENASESLSDSDEPEYVEGEGAYPIACPYCRATVTETPAVNDNDVRECVLCHEAGPSLTLPCCHQLACRRCIRHIRRVAYGIPTGGGRRDGRERHSPRMPVLADQDSGSDSDSDEDIFAAGPSQRQIENHERAMNLAEATERQAGAASGGDRVEGSGHQQSPNDSASLDNLMVRAMACTNAQGMATYSWMFEAFLQDCVDIDHPDASLLRALIGPREWDEMLADMREVFRQRINAHPEPFVIVLDRVHHSQTLGMLEQIYVSANNQSTGITINVQNGYEHELYLGRRFQEWLFNLQGDEFSGVGARLQQYAFDLLQQWKRDANVNDNRLRGAGSTPPSSGGGGAMDAETVPQVRATVAQVPREAVAMDQSWYHRQTPRPETSAARQTEVVRVSRKDPSHDR